MKLFILLLLSSCATLSERGIENFGEVSVMRIKKIDTTFSGIHKDDYVMIKYVKSKKKNCFPASFWRRGEIYTVKYDHYKALMYTILNQTQDWSFTPDKRPYLKGKVNAHSNVKQKVVLAVCSVNFLFPIPEIYEEMYVSFVKENQ
jgi:hypothetical protein